MTTNGKRAMDHVGTRWHKTDLHLHTASSACYAGEYTAKGLVDRALEQGLSCIAVTDHNTGAGIDAVKEAAKDTGLTVFPGVEVTCSDAKVHMLLRVRLHEVGMARRGTPQADRGRRRSPTRPVPRLARFALSIRPETGHNRRQSPTGGC